jgi:hypothetical protein
MKQYPDAPLGLGAIYLSIFYEGCVYTGKGESFDKKIKVCRMCYLLELQKMVADHIEGIRNSRAIRAYDMELDAEIYCDAFGTTREQFEDIAMRRGDDKEKPNA